MNTVAVALSAGSLAWVTITVVAYFAKLPKGELTHKITGLVLQLLAGVGLAIAGIVWAYRSAALGLAVVVPAALAVMLASVLLYLLTLRKTPVGDLKVEVGDRLLAFEAKTSEGDRFHTDELAGKRTLLKFFRGGW